MTEYRCTSRHSEDLADGRVVAPGEVATLSADQQKDAHNQRLIEEGGLVEIAKPKTSRQAANKKESS
jgi:hypothetical protein